MAQFNGTPADDSYNGTSDADIIVSGGGKDVLNGLGGDDQLVLDAPLAAGSAISGGLGSDTLVLRSFATRPALFSYLYPQGVPFSRHDLRGITLSDTIEWIAFESAAGSAVTLELNMAASGLPVGNSLIGGAGYDALVLEVASGSGPVTAPTFVYTDWQTPDRAWLPGDLVRVVAPAATVLEGSAHAGVQVLEVAGGARTINGSGDMDLILGGLNGSNQLHGNGGDDTIAFFRTLGFNTGANGAIAGYDVYGPYAGSVATGAVDGGAGFDFLAFGGYLRVESLSISGIEGIYLSPAWSDQLAPNITGRLQEQTVVSGFDSTHLAQLPADLLLAGVGDLHIDITDDNGFDGSGFRFDPGSQVRLRVYAHDKDDVLIGTSGDDWLVGEAGDDILTGGAGDDEIGGGQGQDVAVFSGERAAYTVTWASDAGIRLAGPDGSDWVTDVETFRFADGDYVRDWFANDLVRLGAPATGTFRMFAGDGFTGTIGGSGTIAGTNGAQNVGLYRGGGDIAFDPSFNRGNDLIRLPGYASDYTATALGSNARLSDELASYAIPVGARTPVWFRYHSFDLEYRADIGGITLAGQKLGSNPLRLWDSDAFSSPPPSTTPQGLARLYLGDDAAVAVGGNYRIFGTSGDQRVTWRDGDIVLDPSFNRGGDVLTIDAAAQDIAAYRSGSNVVLVWGDDTAALPIGAGLLLDFAGADTRLLRAESDAGVWIGDQQITATSAETALHLSAFQAM